MDSKVDVSIIVCAYNAASTIDRCLNSLLAQKTSASFKIIIVNDGSTDDTKEHLDQFNQNEKILLINKKNTGASDSRNIALTRVHSTYVTFVDSDDYVDTDYLETLYDQYKKYPDIDLAISGYQKEEQNGQIIMKAQGNSAIMSRRETLKLIFASYIIEGYLVNKLFKMSIINRQNLKFEATISIAEDLDFCCRYLRYINKSSYIPRPTYHYIMYENSQLNSIKIGKTFSDNNTNLVKTLIKIKNDIIENYPEVNSAINARLCWAATVVLRSIYAAPNKNDVNQSIINNMWSICGKYQKDFLKNDILPRKDKLVYFINKISPMGLAILWKTFKLRRGK